MCVVSRVQILRCLVLLLVYVCPCADRYVDRMMRGEAHFEKFALGVSLESGARWAVLGVLHLLVGVWVWVWGRRRQPFKDLLHNQPT